MEFTIFAKVCKEGSPCRQPGDKIGGKKTGLCKEDGWGVIGRCMIKTNLRIPEGAVLHIQGPGILKAVTIRKGEPKKRHRNLFRFAGFDKLNLDEEEKLTSVIRVIPLSLEA